MVQSFRSMSLSMYRRTSIATHRRNNNGGDNDYNDYNERREGEEGGGDHLLLEEPLLDRGFRVEEDNDNDDNDNDNEETPRHGQANGGNHNDNESNIAGTSNVMDPDEIKELQILLRIFGRSYGSDSFFWLRLVPLSIIMGGLVGTMGIVFLGSYRWILCQWVAATTTTSLSSGKHTLVEALGGWDGLTFGSGRLAWIGITATGGFLVGLVRLLPGAPKTMARTMFHDTMNLSGHLHDAPYILVAAFVSLCAGAPLGPEMSIGTLGSFLASLLARQASFCCMGGGNHNRRHCRRRSEAALVLAGLAASLGGLFVNPLLSVLLIHELSVVSRPGEEITLDGLVQQEALQRQEEHPEEEEEEEEEEQQRGGGEEEEEEDEPMGNGVGVGVGMVATSSSSSTLSVMQDEAGVPPPPPPMPPLSKNPRDHDYMEQISLTGIAATVSFVCFRTLMSIAKIDFGKQSSLPSPPPQDESHHDFSILPLLYAIPLGLICGCVATVFLIWNGVFKTIRVQVGARWENALSSSLLSSWCCFPPPGRMAPLVWTTLAGAWHGGLAVAFPLTLGSGAEFLTDFSSIIGAHRHHLPAWYLATSGLVKLLATASCLGWGLVGGQLFPSAFCGGCLGAALSQWFPFLDSSTTVACCMVAVPGSFIPIPLTLVLFVALVEKSVDLMAPMLVATLVAFSVNGGWGLVGRLARQKLTHDATTAAPATTTTTTMAQSPQQQQGGGGGGGGEDETIMSDGSLLRQIVSAIYAT